MRITSEREKEFVDCGKCLDRAALPKLVALGARAVVEELIEKCEEGYVGWDDEEEWLRAAVRDGFALPKEPTAEDKRKLVLTFLASLAQKCLERRDWTSAFAYGLFGFNIDTGPHQDKISPPTNAADEGDSGVVVGSPEAAGEGGGGGQEASEKMYKKAVALVVGTQVASVGVLREQYDIDLTTAANILDKMADQDIVSVGCIGESSQRRVLLTPEEWVKMQDGGQEGNTPEGADPAQQGEDAEREDPADSPQGHAGGGEGEGAEAPPSDAAEVELDKSRASLIATLEDDFAKLAEALCDPPNAFCWRIFAEDTLLVTGARQLPEDLSDVDTEVLKEIRNELTAYMRNNT